jgi:GNAT superfamily N-acetyltransferase
MRTVCRKRGSRRAPQAVQHAAADVPSATGLTIRPANPGDATPLGFFFDTALRRDYFLRRGQLAEMLQSPYHRVYVAEIDTVLVGVAVTTRGTRLVNALVHPGYRGLGIGRALINQSGATEVRVKRDMSTGDPRGFYAALGFESAGPAPRRENIEIMRRAAVEDGPPHAQSGGQ